MLSRAQNMSACIQKHMAPQSSKAQILSVRKIGLNGDHEPRPLPKSCWWPARDILPRWCDAHVGLATSHTKSHSTEKHFV